MCTEQKEKENQGKNSSLCILQRVTERWRSPPYMCLALLQSSFALFQSSFASFQYSFALFHFFPERKKKWKSKRRLCEGAISRKNWSRAWSGFACGREAIEDQCLESSSYILITCIEDDHEDVDDEDWRRRATNLFCLWERITGGPSVLFCPLGTSLPSRRQREPRASKCTGDDARSKPISNTWMHPDSKLTDVTHTSQKKKLIDISYLWTGSRKPKIFVLMKYFSCKR